jgi:hypothetical protein
MPPKTVLPKPEGKILPSVQTLVFCGSREFLSNPKIPEGKKNDQKAKLCLLLKPLIFCGFCRRKQHRFCKNIPTLGGLLYINPLAGLFSSR